MFGGVNLNDYVAFELGYTQTANETLTFSGSPTPPFLNYTGSFTAGYNGADLGVILHPIQLPIFKYFLLLNVNPLSVLYPYVDPVSLNKISY